MIYLYYIFCCKHSITLPWLFFLVESFQLGSALRLPVDIMSINSYHEKTSLCQPWVKSSPRYTGKSRLSFCHFQITECLYKSSGQVNVETKPVLRKVHMSMITWFCGTRTNTEDMGQELMSLTLHFILITIHKFGNART